MDRFGSSPKRAVPLAWLPGAGLVDDTTVHGPEGARSGQGSSREQTVQQATRSVKLWCRAPRPCAVHAAVAVILLCGAAPAATVQAQDGVPTAPRDLAAASGDKMVTLTWSPPENDGGSDITGYEYQVDEGDWEDAGTADARSFVVSGLENIRLYALSVRAVNGTGPGAAATVEAKPRAAITAPTAPRDLAAEPGDTKVSLSWSPPADDGGSDITNYQIQGGRVTSWLTVPLPEGEPINFYGLENGREYTFSMRAVNRIGTGPTASTKATPLGAPSAPRNLAAAPGDAAVTLTWEPPAEDGGSDVTGYQYQVDEEGWKDGGTADARSVVVSDLENGRSYTFSVRAENDPVGPGTVEMVEATPRPDPIAATAPRDLAAEPGDTMVTLTWSPPANDGGSDISGYEYQVDEEDWEDAGRPMRGRSS